LTGLQRERVVVRSKARGECHQRREAEQHDHGLVARRARHGHWLAEVAAQVVVATNAVVANENLRRGFDAVLGLERIDFRARRQPVVFDDITLAAQ
jgi:hypothetical protein